MATAKQQYIDKHLPGTDPALRIGHRGLVRSFQHHDSALLSDLSPYVRHMKRSGKVYAEQPPYFRVESDGFAYTYPDEMCTVVASALEAAHILNRNRTTLMQYLKNPDFPAKRDGTGWRVDIVAAQDWILWNTDHHSGLEPYWPDIDKNNLISVSETDLSTDEPLFYFH